MRKINVEQIVSLDVYKKSRNYWYTYREARGFWPFKRKEGFYDPLACSPCSKEYLEKQGNVIVLGKEVYYKPHVVIKTSNGHSHEKYFETVSQLEDFLDSPEIKALKLIDKN